MASYAWASSVMKALGLSICAPESMHLCLRNIAIVDRHAVLQAPRRFEHQG
jgi:hypothetical protein